MKEITNLMIREFNIMKNGYDFMGYTVNRKNELSFHHLIVPRRECKEKGIGQGYLRWNGAILVQNTSHDYLHYIETIDRDIFLEITKEMIAENESGKINLRNLKRIRELLLYFESEHINDRNSKGKKYIKEEYLIKRIKL